ncbi:MAG: IS4 family transposase [Gammaproteobacteria bacterium]|nr:IS4 family transposase [Gammaproteobacteria bacterium]
MHAGKLVFAQLMSHLPPMVFERCVARYCGNHKVKSFTCMDQYLCMAFAQLTYRESLRDIEACLRSQAERLYHMGIRSQVSRNTLANANATRDWRIYADFAQRLIGIARKLYAQEPFAVDLANTAYALDSTTIDLSLSLFPWAPFRATKAAVKMHTLLDLRGNIPSFIHISDGKLHDVNILDQLIVEAGAFYVMDRGYIDFSRLYRLHQAGAFYVTRAKKNTSLQRRYSHPVDRSTGLIYDQTLVLQGYQSAKDYPDALRGVRYKDPQTGKRLLFITNNTTLPALSICALYKSRWQVELFFRWIKQHLRVKAFFGTSENAVKSQIWIAVSVYVLVAIVRKRLKLSRSLYEILQILSLNQFEKTPLDVLLSASATSSETDQSHNQLILFD